MVHHELTQEDKTLIQELTRFIEKSFKDPQHKIAAGLVTSKELIIKVINLKSNVGRANICAEAIALGIAVKEDVKQFRTLLVLHKDTKGAPPTVISPCGVCREVYYDYIPEIDVIINEDGKLKKCKMSDLLPHRYDK